MERVWQLSSASIRFSAAIDGAVRPPVSLHTPHTTLCKPSWKNAKPSSVKQDQWSHNSALSQIECLTRMFMLHVYNTSADMLARVDVRLKLVVL